MSTLCPYPTWADRKFPLDCVVGTLSLSKTRPSPGVPCGFQGTASHLHPFPVADVILMPQGHVAPYSGVGGALQPHPHNLGTGRPLRTPAPRDPGALFLPPFLAFCSTLSPSPAKEQDQGSKPLDPQLPPVTAPAFPGDGPLNWQASPPHLLLTPNTFSSLWPQPPSCFSMMDFDHSLY